MRLAASALRPKLASAAARAPAAAAARPRACAPVRAMAGAAGEKDKSVSEARWKELLSPVRLCVQPLERAP
jgi:hypothetical protein